MPLIAYENWKPSGQSADLVAVCNVIITEYEAAGYILTLRQLYYQLVSRDVLPNRQQAYKNLGTIVSKARRAGLIDWNAIEDRTRNLRSNSHWTSPASLVEACASQYRVDLWSNQPVVPEVWIEKDALIGVIERICTRLDVPHFSCRGYCSDSEMWVAAQRMITRTKRGQKTLILDLRDHDPSGIDMTRDADDRLFLFGHHQVDSQSGGRTPAGRKRFSHELEVRAADIEVKRVALNMNQIEQYGPPPNPAKLTDTRAEGYITLYGESSWELDALTPQVLEALIEAELEAVRDNDLWEDRLAEQRAGRDRLAEVAAQLNNGHE